MSDMYFLYTRNPYTSISFFTDYSHTGKFEILSQSKGPIRNDILSAIGEDVMKENQISNKPYHLAPSIELFYTKDPEFHYYHKIGSQFLCKEVSKPPQNFRLFTEL